MHDIDSLHFKFVCVLNYAPYCSVRPYLTCGEESAVTSLEAVISPTHTTSTHSIFVNQSNIQKLSIAASSDSKDWSPEQLPLLRMHVMKSCRLYLLRHLCQSFLSQQSGMDI